ncbi:energy-coupling factor ABC transporter ATP-binding protein [Specibacter cremeus]|uniref:energy-coupling factor ABC transporter ATP-binding protein n=1 Tax=Specibacter cremeus TaxID=1629051 RepID=UPI000F78A12E|nr:ABC transporter ATP-binding protein [Specibacter cremeus]
MSRIVLESAGVSVPAPAGGDKIILRPTTLTLTESRIAVIGANGSGKSTLLRLLNGLVLPSTGTVRVNGLDSRADGPALRRTVGFVFTDPLSQLVMPTPREDVELSLRRRRLGNAERRAAALTLLARYGLAGLAEDSVYDLSGGERQLTALATVLAVEPDVLVLDEPSTLLDLRNTRLLQHTLAALPQQIVMSTHDLALAQAADRVLVVNDGAITFDGLPADAVAHYLALVG